MTEADPPPQASKYVLVMPVRDEAKYLERTIDSVVQQTARPVRLVIVNDGSHDNTGELADAAAREHDWIRVVHREDRGERKVGGGVVDTFYAGYESLDVEDYEYIGKIDGDLSFGPRYFERLLELFREDPKLGGASGKVWNPAGDGFKEEGIIGEMVSGAMNFWRRACFEAMGGYVREVMWDGIAMHRARMCGYETRSIHDDHLRIIHYRLMGSSHKNIFHGRMRWGRGQWFMGTHPLYIVASGVFRMRERPYVVGGLCIILGYVKAALGGVPRYGDAEFRSHLHAWQLRRLGLGWLAHGPKSGA